MKKIRKQFIIRQKMPIYKIIYVSVKFYIGHRKQEMAWKRAIRPEKLLEGKGIPFKI